MRKNIIFIFFAILSLPLIVLITGIVQNIFSRAAPIKANILINTNLTYGPINNSWAAFSQGGEEPPPMLSSSISKMRSLSPKFIRLDHIYDYYSIVEKKGENFSFNFSKLDETVNDITSMGASPFFSLSYMPSAFTKTGSVIDEPVDWRLWQDLIQKTIEHYSGKNNKNMIDLYYEVWNEPELPQFGGWTNSGNKDYRLLYSNAVAGANNAQNVNKFYVGGPGIGSYNNDRKEWLRSFFSYVSSNSLRLDFFSWHRYHLNPNQFASDAKAIRADLSSYPLYSQIPIMLTEWGMESENKPVNNSPQAAAFTVTAVSKFNDLLNYAFTFEIKDGPPPNGGKWGVLTHEKSIDPLSKKPRYDSYLALNNLNGNKLETKGEGTYISVLSSKNNDEINTVISNYDPANKNAENVPITFIGLDPSSYELRYTYYNDQTSGKYDVVTTDGTLNKSFIMPPNSILSLKLIKTEPLLPFIKGEKADYKNVPPFSNLNNLLILHYPEFRLMPVEKISFDIKPLWDENDNTTFIIFESPYSIENGFINRLKLYKQNLNYSPVLIFAVEGVNYENKVSIPISSWQKNNWYNISLGWDTNGIYLSTGKDENIRNDFPLDIRNGKIITFYPINAQIDNLKIIIDNEVSVAKSFGNK
jgi:hypothetical protein